MKLNKLKQILEDDYGWGNLDAEETKWFVDELLEDSINAIKEQCNSKLFSKSDLLDLGNWFDGSSEFVEEVVSDWLKKKTAN